ncbi:MAG TPA: nuclear transport factor 2 family protein [Sphingobium sp.]
MTDEVTLLKSALHRIEAERAIERLIHSYGHVLDFDTADAYADLFASDGAIEIQSDFANNFGQDLPAAYVEQGLANGGQRTERGIVFRGRDALKTFVAKNETLRRFSHVVSQPLVTITGPDTAEALSYMRVYFQDVAGQAQLQGFGRYTDRFVRIGEAWRIQHRICEI